MTKQQHNLRQAFFPSLRSYCFPLCRSHGAASSELFFGKIISLFMMIIIFLSGMQFSLPSCVNILTVLKVKGSEVAQSCPTLCDPMDCSLPGSSVHGIFQARVLEWVAISFSRDSSRPRDQTQVSCIVDRRFTV